MSINTDSRSVGHGSNALSQANRIWSNLSPGSSPYKEKYGDIISKKAEGEKYRAAVYE